MNKNTLIIVIALVILIIGGFLILKRPAGLETESLSLEEEETSLPSVKIATPNGVILQFMDNLYQAAEPKSDPAALNLMVSLLSPMAKKIALDEAGNYNPTLWLGLTTAPDLGYEIMGVRYSDNLATAQTNGVAEVTVKMKYSEENIEKTFILSRVEDYWLIDGLVLSEAPTNS